MVAAADDENNESQDPYSFDREHGWRRYRMLRPGWGMYHDVRRRLPYYWSDIKDGVDYRTVAGTVRIYFVKYVVDIRFLCFSLSMREEMKPDRVDF